MASPFLIIGLGNVGKDYTETRHNVGFMAIDHTQKTLGLPEFTEEKKWKAYISQGTYQDTPIMLAKPTTLMNNSGESARLIMDYFHVYKQRIMIIYDDIDIDAGTIRMRKSGSSGTHNGMRSVVKHLGTESIARLRIGIKPLHPTSNLASYVLGRMTHDEKDMLDEVLPHIDEAIKLFAMKEIDKAMNLYN